MKISVKGIKPQLYGYITPIVLLNVYFRWRESNYEENNDTKLQQKTAHTRKKAETKQRNTLEKQARRIRIENHTKYLK